MECVPSNLNGRDRPWPTCGGSWLIASILIGSVRMRAVAVTPTPEPRASADTAAALSGEAHTRAKPVRRATTRKPK